MGRAGFKEIVLINRLDEAGWLRAPSPVRASWAIMAWALQLWWSEQNSDISSANCLWFWGQFGAAAAKQSTVARLIHGRDEPMLSG